MLVFLLKWLVVSFSQCPFAHSRMRPIVALNLLVHFIGIASHSLAFTDTTISKQSDRLSTLHSTKESLSSLTMEETYDRVATDAVAAWKKQCDGKQGRLWIAVAGTPGSGKSTVSRNVVQRINQQLGGGDKAICIPMDGYHLTQDEMKLKGYDMKRRGAPYTFDATRMYHDLKNAREEMEGRRVSFPDYSREKSDPVPNQIHLEDCHDIVLVEGLYVLLGSLCKDLDDPNSPVNQAARELGQESWIAGEIQRWKPMMELWDQSIFVEPPGGFEVEGKRRLVERSLKTWNPAKTELWCRDCKTDREAATLRVEMNDEKNAKLISCCKPYASTVVETK